jgi:putative oxidoreductase
MGSKMLRFTSMVGKVGMRVMNKGKVALRQSNFHWYNKAIIGFFRLLLGAILVFSGLQKIQNPYAFLESVYQFELLGPSGSLFVAVIIPFCEVVVGVCLLAGIGKHGALLCAIALFGIFSWALSTVVYRGLSASCGCFGTISDGAVGWGTVIRTVVLFVLSCITLAGEKLVGDEATSATSVRSGTIPSI